MKIGIVSTHAWPIPNPARTGDIYVLDLAIALQAAGHDVTMFSPEGTQFSNVRHIPCAHGKYPPSSIECESKAYDLHKHELATMDIVHDVTQSKLVAHYVNKHGGKTCCTINGGPWREPMYQPPNLIVQSKAQRERILRGATDYENTPTPDLGGPPGIKVADAHVVYDGIDTDFYCPSDYAKDDHVLWLNRWHPTKGYALAIEFAKAHPGIKLLIAGESPANETSDYQRQCAIDAARLALGAPNISFQWLPGDPEHNIVKRELYRRAIALIYTTQFQEPFGLSQVEAMACGTPVIATRFGSIPEIINHGVTGHICTQDADILGRIADGVKWARDAAIGPTIRAEAVARFDKAVMAQNYLAEYEAIVGGASW